MAPFYSIHNLISEYSASHFRAYEQKAKDGFMRESGAPDADLRKWSFRNDHTRIPYVVVVDRETESIVVAIRGTYSLLDFVTDLSCKDQPAKSVAR